MPTTAPSAISGPSGPSTAPNDSVPIAASAMPGAYESSGGFPAKPCSGLWPPSPGRKRRAIATRHAPATGRPMTRYQGGDDSSKCCGKVMPEPVLHVAAPRRGKQTPAALPGSRSRQPTARGGGSPTRPSRAGYARSRADLEQVIVNATANPSVTMIPTSLPPCSKASGIIVLASMVRIAPAANVRTNATTSGEASWKRP